jgi:hypothetical protein
MDSRCVTILNGIRELAQKNCQQIVRLSELVGVTSSFGSFNTSSNPSITVNGPVIVPPGPPGPPAGGVEITWNTIITSPGSGIGLSGGGRVTVSEPGSYLIEVDLTYQSQDGLRSVVRSYLSENAGVTALPSSEFYANVQTNNVGINTANIHYVYEHLGPGSIEISVFADLFTSTPLPPVFTPPTLVPEGTRFYISRIA